jgi:hypothetical protein
MKPYTMKQAWQEAGILARDLKKMTPHQRLAEIRAVIDRVAQRCCVVDGPVSKEREEITEAEFKAIYLLTTPTKNGCATCKIRYKNNS